MPIVACLTYISCKTGMSEPSFKELLHKYNSGNCTPDEKAIIEAWYQQMELPGLPPLTDEQLQEIADLQPNVAAPVKTRSLRPWLSAAAAVIIIAVSVTFYLIHRQRLQHPVQQFVKLPDDALPGSNKAVLTLANGQKIILNNSPKGKLAQQGNVTVEKDTDGLLTYSVAPGENSSQVTDARPMFNTVITPRGGQHHLILADGTNVWLNAASSIKYPTDFTGNERRVKITGEAYFEVAHNALKPFRVVSDGQVVEVLGTHFNIDAYADEPVVKTTLLKGSVKVTNTGNGNSVMLRPGQQATLSGSKQIEVTEADLEAAVAWKEGDFIFKNQTLPDIMRKIARWYDVDVDYGDYRNSTLTFSGEVSRSRKLSAVLQMLETTAAVKFTIRNNKVTITNKNITN